MVAPRYRKLSGEIIAGQILSTGTAINPAGLSLYSKADIPVKSAVTFDPGSSKGRKVKRKISRIPQPGSERQTFIY